MRATAAAMRAEARRLRDEAAVSALALEKQAELLEQAAGLTIGKQRSTVDSNMDVDLTGRPENVRTAANRARHKNEARQALTRANKTDADVAAELKIGRSTANAYVTGRLPIPRHHATHLEREWRIPPSVWLKVGE